jgi:hypothetical protein
MYSSAHHVHNYFEPLEFSSFGANKWVFFEERNDAIRQALQAPDAEAPDVLSMIVVPRIAYDVAAAEELFHSVKNTYALLSLHDREGWLDLPTHTTRSIPKDWNTETTFAVDEADDPLRKAWPFLLIVRTGRIFTNHLIQPTKRLYQPVSSAGFSGFPAYSQLHFQNYS